MVGWLKYGETSHWLIPVPSTVSAPHEVLVKKRIIAEFTGIAPIPPIIIATYDVFGKTGENKGREYLAYQSCLMHLTTHLLQQILFVPFSLIHVADLTNKIRMHFLDSPVRRQKYPLSSGGAGRVKETSSEFQRKATEIKQLEKSIKILFEPMAYIVQFWTLLTKSEVCGTSSTDVVEIQKAYVDALGDRQYETIDKIDMLNWYARKAGFPFPRDYLLAICLFWGSCALFQASTRFDLQEFYSHIGEFILGLGPKYGKSYWDEQEQAALQNEVFNRIAWKLKKGEFERPTNETLADWMNSYKSTFQSISENAKTSGSYPHPYVDACVTIASTFNANLPLIEDLLVSADKFSTGVLIYLEGSQPKSGILSSSNDSLFQSLIPCNLHYQAACHNTVACPFRGVQNLHGAECDQCIGRFSSQTRRKLHEDCTIFEFVQEHASYLLEIKERAQTNSQ